MIALYTSWRQALGAPPAEAVDRRQSSSTGVAEHEIGSALHRTGSSRRITPWPAARSSPLMAP
eukprot:scaffold60197_cov35-Phaeocystis_antarctica.AAC.2